MTTKGKVILEPVAYQSSDAELQEAVNIDATPKSRAWVFIQSGPERRATTKQKSSKA